LVFRPRSSRQRSAHLPTTKPTHKCLWVLLLQARTEVQGGRKVAANSPVLGELLGQKLIELGAEAAVGNELPPVSFIKLPVILRGRDKSESSPCASCWSAHAGTFFYLEVSNRTQTSIH
jgi:hypothetical protein